MDEKRPKVRRNDVIHCENCGEDYASIYKRCPFCDEVNSAGRRVRTDRGGGYSSGMSPMRILTIVIPLVLIIAAVCIVITVVGPLIHRGNSEQGESQPPVNNTESVSPEPTDSAGPDETGDPEPTDDQPVTSSDVTGITLNREDFTMSAAGETWDLKPTVTPAGATGEITWTSSDEKVATVENGVVTAVGGGNCTVTATSGTATATCIVRVKGAAASSGGSTTTPSTGGSLTLSRTEFALNDTWPSYTIQVTGASGTVSWSSSDTSVATVDANGTVKKVSTGRCTITASSGGKTATCIVYVN